MASHQAKGLTNYTMNMLKDFIQIQNGEKSLNKDYGNIETVCCICCFTFHRYFPRKKHLSLNKVSFNKKLKPSEPRKEYRVLSYSSFRFYDLGFR